MVCSVNEVFNTLAQKLQVNGKVSYQSPRSGDIRHSVLNPEKAKRLLNWQASYNLQQGIKKMITLQMDATSH